ncbi:WD40-repeat-containing domain protein [Dipodascopsis tothii]|uniref:WD40-repeat-containing domain protein n=1 Tax=Dipodascopsis tothii TaxID=44089 RepID=UPI0034CF51EC
MSAPRQKIQPVRNAVLPAQTTPEQRYWRAYKTPLIIKDHAPITNISFSSTHIAITAGPRVQLLSTKTRQPIKTISRFKDVAFSGDLRSDGKLLAAGDASGLIQIFDVNSRGILVTLNPTQQDVRVVKFHEREITRLFSGSDDRVARIWDITSSKPVVEYGEHGDYVRAGAFLPGSSNLVTGSYDGVVRLFDPRTPRAVAQLEHGAAVESVLPLTGTTVLSAGGPEVKVWDIVSGRTVAHLTNFQKTVTSLCLGGGETNAVLAGALDGHVKVFDTTSWEVKFGWKFGGAILSCGVSLDQRHFVAGSSEGLLAVRTRKSEPRVKQGVKKAKGTNYARMVRGADYKGTADKAIVDDTRKSKKLRQYERYINAFQWGDALDCAFRAGTPIELTITILDELKRRGKARVSLLNRDEATLEPLMRWAVRNISDFRNVDIIADWVGVAVDMYGSTMERSGVLGEMVDELRRKVAAGIDGAREASRIGGMVEMLLA